MPETVGQGDERQRGDPGSGPSHRPASMAAPTPAHTVDGGDRPVPFAGGTRRGTESASTTADQRSATAISSPINRCSVR